MYFHSSQITTPTYKITKELNLFLVFKLEKDNKILVRKLENFEKKYIQNSYSIIYYAKSHKCYFTFHVILLHK